MKKRPTKYSETYDGKMAIVVLSVPQTKSANAVKIIGIKVVNAINVENANGVLMI